MVIGGKAGKTRMVGTWQVDQGHKGEFGAQGHNPCCDLQGVSCIGAGMAGGRKHQKQARQV